MQVKNIIKTNDLIAELKDHCMQTYASSNHCNVCRIRL